MEDNWISVNDDYYPIGDMEVIAITRQGFMFIGRYIGKDWRNVDQWRLKTEKSEHTVIGKVTHWMRKPPDPIVQSAECGFEFHPDYNVYCPKCGAKLVDYCLTICPPIHLKQCPKCGWKPIVEEWRGTHG